MPVYEYRCERGHLFEITQRMADDALTTCVECTAPVNRVFHPIAVHFKGSGFYNTDYGRAKSDRNQNGGEPSGGDSSSSKSEEGVGKATTKDGGEKGKQASGSSSGSSSEGSGSSGSGSDSGSSSSSGDSKSKSSSD